MSFWLDLMFGNFIGILSLFTIFFIIGMAVWFIKFFFKKMDEEARQGQPNHSSYQERVKDPS